MKSFILIFVMLLCSVSFASEEDERAAISELSADAFKNADFEELERQAAEYLSEESKTESGTWKLPYFYRGIGIEGIPLSNIDDDGWSQAMEKFDAWVQSFPKSATPYVARGNAYMQRAYRLRGFGWANSIDAGNRTKYIESIIAAAEYLMENAEVGRNDPHWYRTLADAYKHLGVEKGPFLDLVREGLAKFPNYDELTFIGADYLSAKWHGSLIELEEFARESVERTRRDRGFEIYARIYWAAGFLSNKTYAFQSPTAKWDDMVLGIDEIITRYPSQWNIQFFTYFACYKQDFKVAERYMMLIEDPIILDAWNVATNVDRCRFGIEHNKKKTLSD